MNCLVTGGRHVMLRQLLIMLASVAAAIAFGDLGGGVGGP